MAKKDTAIRRMLEAEIRRGRERVREHTAELRKIEDSLKGASMMYKAKFGDLPPEKPPLPAKGDSQQSVLPIQATQPRNRFANLSIREAAQVVLEESPHPMKVRGIYEAIARGGKAISSAAPAETVRTILNRYPTIFKKLPDGKWTLNREAA